MSATTNFDIESPHQLSPKLLSQLSGARVDPYTNYVASIVCKDFKPAIQGQRLVNSALSNLPIYFTPEEKLTFGWSLSNVIRVQEVHEAGYEHLAIMLALGESFHESFAAEVMHEMAVSMAGPEDITPHLSQWREHLQSCNGALAATDFAVTVEDYIRLDPYSIALNNATANVEWQIPISPKAVAEALKELSNVTSGREKQITLIGSAVLGWFAAVAEQLYDLHVALFSVVGEQLLACSPDQEAQVVLIYEPKPGLRVSSRPWRQEFVQRATAETKIQDIETGLLQIEMRSQQYQSSIHSMPFGGRVMWQSLLPQVFGRSFSYLDHEEAKSFGTMIGAAARLFQGLALGEGENTDLVSTQNKSNPASFGPGLIQTLTNWLPELRRIQGRMERPLKLASKEAGGMYLEQLTKIRHACHCGICSSKGEVDKSMEGKPPAHGYCLTTLVETVIALGLALSRIIVSAQIFPSRAGIQSIYVGQVAKRLEARGLPWQQHFQIVYGNEWNASNARRLQNCVTIFSGSSPRVDLPQNLIALSHQGICVYFMKLEKNLPQPETDTIIKVVSGGINIRQKVFKRACLGPVERRDINDQWEKVLCEHLAESLYCK